MLAAGMIAVHTLDLDRFKEANDRFGHPVGDALLKQVAGRLKALAAQDDLVVPIGAATSSSWCSVRRLMRKRWRSASCSRSACPTISTDK